MKNVSAEIMIDFLSESTHCCDKIFKSGSEILMRGYL